MLKKMKQLSVYLRYAVLLHAETCPLKSHSSWLHPESTFQNTATAQNIKIGWFNKFILKMELR